MNVKEIVKKELKKNGDDGLILNTRLTECSCDVNDDDDFMVCDICEPDNCKPYKKSK